MQDVTRDNLGRHKKKQRDRRATESIAQKPHRFYSDTAEYGSLGLDQECRSLTIWMKRSTAWFVRCEQPMASTSFGSGAPSSGLRPPKCDGFPRCTARPSGSCEISLHGFLVTQNRQDHSHSSLLNLRPVQNASPGRHLEEIEKGPPLRQDIL